MTRGRPARVAALAIVVGALALVPGLARAEGASDPGEAGEATPPAPARPDPLLGAPAGFSGAAFVGYTAKSPPFRFTIGARAGYTFDLPIYLGAMLVFYSGDSFESDLTDESLRMLAYGAELGYDFAFGPVVLRPFVGGGGNASLHKIKRSGMTERDSWTDAFLAYGATALYGFDDAIFVGGELRATHVFADPENLEGIGVLVTFGLRL